MNKFHLITWWTDNILEILDKVNYITKITSSVLFSLETYLPENFKLHLWLIFLLDSVVLDNVNLQLSTIYQILQWDWIEIMFQLKAIITYLRVHFWSMDMKTAITQCLISSSSITTTTAAPLPSLIFVNFPSSLCAPDHVTHQSLPLLPSTGRLEYSHPKGPSNL